MRKILRYALPILLLTGMTFLGCPDKKTAESEKGTIEKWTEKTAKEAVDKLRAPIEKARALKEQTDDRMRDMTNKLNEQAQGAEKKAPTDPAQPQK